MNQERDGIKISVCIITFNEEENIRDCLESVRWADEIIIVDSWSTDKTIAIAREYTDAVYQIAWEGFGRAKNAALSKATMPWVFVLDADERIPSELEDEIMNLDGQYDAYMVPRRSFFRGKWIKYGGWYPDYTVRLIKNGAGAFKERRVHEALEVNGTIGYLKNPLEHYTYKDITDFLTRLNRYSSLSAEEKSDISSLAIIFSLLFRPFFTFFKMYILKRGFLGGMPCFILALLYASYVLAKYAKMWEMKEQRGRTFNRKP